MKRRLTLIHSLVITFGLVSIAGCGGGNHCNNCFTVTTKVTINNMAQTDGGVTVDGNVTVPPIEFQTDCDINPAGQTSFAGTTNAQGVFTLQNAAFGHSCAWSIIRGTSAKCPQGSVTNVFATIPGASFVAPCGVAINTFTITPAHINPANPPATITITGQNMYSTYAMPQVYYYDQNENVVLQTTATSASGDGTSLVVPAGQIALLPEADYAAVVYVEQSNGTWNAVGGAGVAVFTPPPPPTRCKPPMLCC